MDGVPRGMSVDDYEDFFFTPEPEAQPSNARPVPFAKGSATSEHAARALDPKLRSHRAREVLNLFLSGETFTRAEAVARLNHRTYQGTTARIWELCQAGCLVETGETRLTDRNKPAAVLKWVPGTSIEKDYDPWIKGDRKSNQPLSSWRKALDAAAAAYQKRPTEHNMNALCDLALARPAPPSGK